jgi:hypothetical protein
MVSVSGRMKERLLLLTDEGVVFRHNAGSVLETPKNNNTSVDVFKIVHVKFDASTMLCLLYAPNRLALPDPACSLLPHILPSLPQILPQLTPSVLPPGMDRCTCNLRDTMLLQTRSCEDTFTST